MSAKRIGYGQAGEKKKAHAPALPSDLEKLFVEKVLKKNAKRPQLKAALDFVHKGDVLVVENMNCLADNPLELTRTIRNFTDKGVVVEFFREGQIFSGSDDPISMLVSILSTGFPRWSEPLSGKKNTSDTSRDAVVRKKSKKTLTAEKVNELKRRAAAGENKTVLAKDFAISREMLHQYLKQE
jgi:hypothetical protein